MKIITYYEGCETRVDCMGPKNPFYMIFNTQLEFIYYPLIFSLIPTLFAGVVLLSLKKKKVVNLSNIKIALILVLIYLLCFVWLANWTWVVY